MLNLRQRAAKTVVKLRFVLVPLWIALRIRVGPLLRERLEGLPLALSSRLYYPQN